MAARDRPVNERINSLSETRKWWHAQYERKNYFNPAEDRNVHQMSDGLSYAKSDEGKWYIVWD